MIDQNKNMTQQSPNEVKQTEKNPLIDARNKSLHQINTANSGGFEWLTEHSRQFLAAGYLTEGVSAEERIREIGGTFKTRAIRTANSVLANDVPEFKIKTCKGLGNPNDCGKLYKRLIICISGGFKTLSELL